MFDGKRKIPIWWGGVAKQGKISKCKIMRKTLKTIKHAVSANIGSTGIRIYLSQIYATGKNTFGADNLLYVFMHDSHPDQRHRPQSDRGAGCQDDSHYEHHQFCHQYHLFNLVVSLFLRAVCYNELRLDQKKFYCIRYRTGFIADVKRFLSQKEGVINLLLEYAVVFPQAQLYYQGKYIELFDSYDEIMIKHDINNAGCLLSMFRVYIFIRSLINITMYSTPRAVRLCSYNRVDHTMMYSIKCLLQESPLRTIMTVFITQEIVLGYSMRISEGQVSHDNPHLPQTGF